MSSTLPVETGVVEALREGLDFIASEYGPAGYATDDVRAWSNEDACHVARTMEAALARYEASLCSSPDGDTHRATDGAGVGDLTPGQLYHELRRRFFNGGGWADYPQWSDYDEAGHAEWEALAREIGTAGRQQAAVSPDTQVGIANGDGRGGDK